LEVLIAEYVERGVKPDRDSEYGPPNKAQHFCEDDDFAHFQKQNQCIKSHERAKNK